MNKFYKSAILMAAGAMLLSCHKEIDAPTPNQRPVIDVEPAIVDAQFTLTRSSMTGANVDWVQGVKASISDGVQEGLVSFEAESVKSKTAVFSGQISNQADLFYVLYPESQVKSFAEGSAVMEVPENQVAGPAGEGISLPAVGMTALTTGTLRNVSSAVVLNNDYDNVKAIRLISIDGEPLAGTLSVDVYENEISVAETGASTVTVTAAEGETLSAGTVTIAVLPGSVAGGFKVESESVDGNVATSWFYEPYELTAGKAVVLGGVKKPLAEKESFTAELTEATSSTLTFAWAPSGDAAVDAATSYTFGLYNDEACTDLFVQFSTDGSSSVWNNRSPKFIFTGLEQGKTYWFKALVDDYAADDEFIKASNVVSGTTSTFDIVTSAQSANVGDILIAEDFSELLWFGDMVGQAAGHVNVAGYKDGATIPSNPGQALGEGNTDAKVTFTLYGQEARLFSHTGAAVAGTRLNSWGQINEGSSNLVCMRPGYVKLGAESRVGFIVTPEINSLAEGKYYDLKVTYKAARYESDPCFGLVQVVTGSNLDNHNVDVTETVWNTPVAMSSDAGWHEYSALVRSVKKGDRIAVGMDRAGSGTNAGASQLRAIVDEIKVEVVKINDNPVLADPVINYRRIAYSDALLKWDPVSNALGYRLYLDGSLYKETTGTEVDITGLQNNSDHSIRLVAYDNTQESSVELSFKTKNVWQIKGRNQGCRMATFQWDPLEADFGAVDINGNKRLYQMEIYSDAACQNVVYTCYPYNGYASTNTGFANSSWLGKKNGTNLLYDTRITFGSLKPATTYWFRVRTLDSFTITYHGTGSDKTMTNPAGTCEWSEPLEFTTPARHTLAANEVAYIGFDDFCVQMDFSNGCIGTTPATTSRNGYAAAVANGANHWAGNFCTYEFAISGHQPDTWGFGSGAKYIDGSSNPTPTQSCLLINANGGDVAGCYMSQCSRPAMGALFLDGDRRWVSTPPLESDLLKDDVTTTCTLTFTYIAVSNAPASFSQSIEVRQYNPSTIYDGQTYKVVKTIKVDPPFLEGAAATNTDFTPDFSGVTATVDVDLYKGEALMIVNSNNTRLVIDDIRVVVK
ncbi:MAG: hypothetical protein ACI3Z0_09090 [Candidatus Cryptobacteroides sp.]